MNALEQSVNKACDFEKGIEDVYKQMSLEPVSPVSASCRVHIDALVFDLIDALAYEFTTSTTSHREAADWLDWFINETDFGKKKMIDGESYSAYIDKQQYVIDGPEKMFILLQDVMVNNEKKAKENNFYLCAFPDVEYLQSAGVNVTGSDYKFTDKLINMVDPCTDEKMLFSLIYISPVKNVDAFLEEIDNVIERRKGTAAEEYLTWFRNQFVQKFDKSLTKPIQ